MAHLNVRRQRRVGEPSEKRAQTADDTGWIDELSLGMDEEFR
jgi:hypothetical protein